MPETIKPYTVEFGTLAWSDIGQLDRGVFEQVRGLAAQLAELAAASPTEPHGGALVAHVGNLEVEYLIERAARVLRVTAVRRR